MNKVYDFVDDMTPLFMLFIMVFASVSMIFIMVVSIFGKEPSKEKVDIVQYECITYTDLSKECKVVGRG